MLLVATLHNFTKAPKNYIFSYSRASFVVISNIVRNTAMVKDFKLKGAATFKKLQSEKSASVSLQISCMCRGVRV